MRGRRQRRGRFAPPALALHQRRSDGFLMPLAALVSLLLLLGSLSVQAVSLQGRLRGEAERELQAEEDRLHSAAQLLIARLQLRHACLLPLPMEHWAGAGCAGADELAQLRRGSVLGATWQLLRWQPEASSHPAASAAATPASSAAAPASESAPTAATSTLSTSTMTTSTMTPSTAPPPALPASAPEGSPQPVRLGLELVVAAMDRQPARRAGFSLQLQGPPWRVLELRPLGLRGETP